ncbi:2OG-Fe(II) oxygenase [Nocardia sp. NPDC059240]|uniref:2OG-Fe(II) oxygenase n=1 Tax=Nocardia sp. NPDC059240 TaxID=3346786 RepID=UPI003688CC1C
MTEQSVLAIGELLAGVGAGRFATRRSSSAGDLSIEVDGVGALAWPVSAEQARALCAVADPARYGLREQTLLDPNVRDTWEVPRGKVRIDRERWGRTLGPVLEAVREDLGLAAECELSAELHSMLVYEPGQFFLRHRDSEKADGMIGTLVVTLPSEFSGGGLVVEHDGESITDVGAADRLGFVAFYADCEHEVLPVTEGYRISLTYNLIAKNGTGAGAAGPVTALAEQLREHFATPVEVPLWRRDGGPETRAPQRLIYLLDHQYSQRGLAQALFKGGDAARAAALIAAAGLAGCETALASAEVREAYAYEPFDDEEWMCGRRRKWEFLDGAWKLVNEDFEPIDDVDEPLEDESGNAKPADHPDLINPEEFGRQYTSHVTLTWWFDRQGDAGQAIDTSIYDDELCGDTTRSPGSPFAVETEGYMGNDGCTVDRWYRRAAIVVLPKGN